MPIGFGLEEPTDMSRIVAALAPYSTQEAAESDFMRAPQGRNYLFDQYQRLTGDMTSDPFRDVFEAKRRARQQQEDAAVATLQPGAPGSVFPANVSMAGAREIGRDLRYRNMSDEAQPFHLASTRLQVPDRAADPDKYYDVIKERAARYGVGGLFENIASKNPQLFKTETPSEPFYGIGSENKKVGREAFNPAFLTPEFRQAYDRNPEQARKLYAAVTGRSSLEADIESQRQLGDEQHKIRRSLLEEIEKGGIERDPKTGALTRQIKTTDLGGGIKMVKQPLTEHEMDILKAEGGNLPSGVALPKFDVPPIKGRSPQEMDSVQKLAARKHQSGIPWQQAVTEATTELSAAEAKLGQRNTSTEGLGISEVANQWDIRDPIRMLLNAGTAFSNAGISATNLIPRSYNAIAAGMGGEDSMSTIPYFQPYGFRMPAEEIRGRATTAERERDILSRMARGFNR